MQDTKREIDWHGFNIIAGPCSIESYESLYATALELKQMGIRMLRGGAYKLRTSPHSFRGLGDAGVLHLSQVAKELELISVSECTQIDKVEYMSRHLDVLLVGTRNMHNYPLLEALAQVPNPIILKRGIAASYSEWLAAAEYLMQYGKKDVILCERGIRTFESETRYTLDISAIPVMRSKCGLPVYIDPSHASGKRDLVPALSLAAVAAGANGLMLEAAINPCASICDASQTISLDTLRSMMQQIQAIKNHI